MDAPAAIRQTFLDPNNVIGYPEDLVGNPEMDGYDKVIDYLHEYGFANRCVGLNGIVTLKQFGRGQDKFSTKLPESKNRRFFQRYRLDSDGEVRSRDITNAGGC